ncbi:MAG: hypothetical protein AVDCRST_MAG11-2345 [uncultured Gemmatimonadaceae bacterium]|uniref:Uncharacterized protein n=1 Tax=uncultured Gemmatimonadaceae bacterium TaxID=246130 RepID=A0A6J4LAE7_9BACT|nr:MAG: hypothetical protein AVDCRST_MAG11-2345 [uncultured Gemmatimonadaceae bacterium]
MKLRGRPRHGARATPASSRRGRNPRYRIRAAQGDRDGLRRGGRQR